MPAVTTGGGIVPGTSGPSITTGIGPTKPNPAMPGTAAAAAGTYYAPSVEEIQGAENYTAAEQAYQAALAQYNNQRGSLLAQYGYKGTIDPATGLVKNIGVDTGNSTGLLQNQLSADATQDAQAQMGMEDRGIFGGLANQAVTSLKQSHDTATSQLANELLGNLSDIDQEQAGDQSALNQALWQDELEADQDAVSAGDWNPGNPTQTTGGATGTSMSKAAAVAAALAHAGLTPVSSITPSTANKLVTQALKQGQVISEHGLGQNGGGAAPKAAATKYHTYAKNVPLKKGQTVHYTPGKGYYAA